MPRRPTIVVVGLGPGDPGLVTAATLDAIAATPVRFLRTARHPSASLVADAAAFDEIYEAADTFADVYAEIVERLVAAAVEHGTVLYAVPGSPRVLERAVDRLVTDDRVDAVVHAAMSFLDLAWVRLGIDPIEVGVRLVDGHTFATSAAGERGPLLVAHCHNRRVLSDIKLSVDEFPDTPVTVIQRLGLPEEAIFTVDWADLDRDVEADHLTSIYIPELASPVAAELVRFGELVRTLRAQCPWDREQTHASLRRHLVEEAYEALDAIDGFDPETGDGADDLEEELGDVLFQVFLHAVIAAEAGWFDLADVARTVHDKLHARHPHVFGDDAMPDLADLSVSWEANKQAEKARDSVLDGIATGLPALAHGDKVLKKATALGLETHDELVREAGSTLAAVGARRGEVLDEGAVGRALVAVVALARNSGVDGEMALRSEVNRLAARIRRIERMAAESDMDVISATPEQRAEWWRKTAAE